MVSIFDDDSEEVGSEIEAYCPKCKADTTHVIISKYEDEIRRVQCNPCGDVHAFRKPRGETEEEPPEPISVKKRAAKVKPTWDQVMAKAKKQPRLYLVAERYAENELLSHPKFGVGFVSEVIGLDKIEVTFQAEKRVLIHNRQGMSLPPAAYAHAVDATLPGVEKSRKGKGAKPVEAAADGHAPAAKATEKPAEKAKAHKPEKAAEKPAEAAKAKPAPGSTKKPVVATEKAGAKAKPVAARDGKAAKAAKPEKPAAKPAKKEPPSTKAAAKPKEKDKGKAKDKSKKGAAKPKAAAKSNKGAAKARPKAKAAGKGARPSAKSASPKAAAKRPISHTATKARPQKGQTGKTTAKAAKTSKKR